MNISIIVERQSKATQRGRHSVINGRLVWTCPSKDGNVISYIWKTTDKEFQIATPEEVEMFNNIVNNK